jgi:hypothetical protein
MIILNYHSNLFILRRSIKNLGENNTQKNCVQDQTAFKPVLDDFHEQFLKVGKSEYLNNKPLKKKTIFRIFPF